MMVLVRARPQRRDHERAHLVVFDSGVADVYRTGDPPQPPTSLKSILATLDWAPDPANEASWARVSDWAK